MSTAQEKLDAVKVQAFERKERRPNVAFDMTKAELVDENNQKLDWDIFSGLLSVKVGLTITGASTVNLEVEDPRGDVMNDPIFSKWMFRKERVSKSSAKTYSSHKITASNKTARYGEEAEEEWILPERPIDLNLDGIWFRLCGWQVQNTTLILEFEDRVAQLLRIPPGFSTVNRGDFTRAQFIEKQVREMEREHRGLGHVPLFIPELGIVQPVAEPSGEVAHDLKSGATRSLSLHDGITVKGVPATEAQLKILNTALEKAVELKGPFKAQVALVEALIVENSVSNPDPGTPADMGVLSMEEATAHAMPQVNPFNISDPVAHFLAAGFTGAGGAIAIARAHPHLSAAEIAQQVQGSGAGAGSNGEATYGKYRNEAEHAVRTYGATENEEGGTEGTVPGPYAFTRGPNETYWDCIMRLASEVGWYAFVRDNTLWYVSGDFLFAQESQLKVVRGVDGIDEVNPHVDIGARDHIAEIEVKGRARLWTAVAGNAVQVARVGPASGKWIIDTVSLDALDRSDAITVKLQKPLPPRPEPAASGTSTSGTELERGSGARGANKGTAIAAFYAANTLSELQLPYLWGGGHSPGSLAQVKKGGPGLDCSGSTSWVLHEAGMYPSTTGQVSTAFESWGEAGEGKEMTVWANADHVWIEFKIPGHAHARGDTVSPGDVGFRLQSEWPPPEGTAGFTPRHWPGT